ncbi:hypothetical protein WMY93_008031 [Mugilogobius chulae]|uniref:PiggyBac transposable element-derived protein domain-containing protein n=1 Tax=Mugilogobius chulae TaxID=88201 RepID=A0AAW0PES5_9GOBI
MASKRRLSVTEALKMLQNIDEADSGGDGESDDDSWAVDSSAESDSESEAEDVQPPPKRSRTTSMPSHHRQFSGSLVAVQAATVCVATTSDYTRALTSSSASIDAQHERERGKDGTIWTLVNGEERGRRQSQNVLTEAEGPTTYARRRVQDPLTSFMCLMDADTLEHIRACTVSEAHRVLGNMSWQMEVDELLAFIALVYVRGAKGGRTLELSSFWSADWGLPYFKETMARNRFQAIMRFLRLDQKETRNARLESNKFALASEVWESFVSNCILCYKPGPDITIDEQLLPTKARCPFTQYMANKPDKFAASQPPATTRERSHPPLPSIDAQHERERGKDGTIWTLVNGEERGRRQSQNDPLTSFMCLMDADTLEHIRACTVSEAHRVLGNTSWQMEVDELLAFIALVYVRGAKGAGRWSCPAFGDNGKKSLPGNNALLRLDQKETRNARLESNKFALASEVWESFVSNCILCYKPGPDITIDEQLLPTKARCPFTQYMANKPDKFGIKFWVAADVNTKYMLNAAPYLGKDVTRTPGQRLGDSVVLKLAEPFTGKGRNITTDNFFTSLDLARALQEQKTSLVGTMNKKRRELPPSVQEKRPLFSSKVLKSAHATLTIYQGKAKTNVSILSTVHSSAGTLSGPKAKPEPVVYYNRTKVGVDVLDQMLRMYSVKAATRRWPVAVFYNILDMAAVTAWILYKNVWGAKYPDVTFIFELANALRANHMSAKERPAVPVSVSVAFEQGADFWRGGANVRCGKTAPKNRSKDACVRCRKLCAGNALESQRDLRKLQGLLRLLSYKAKEREREERERERGEKERGEEREGEREERERREGRERKEERRKERGEKGREERKREGREKRERGEGREGERNKERGGKRERGELERGEKERERKRERRGRERGEKGRGRRERDRREREEIERRERKRREKDRGERGEKEKEEKEKKKRGEREERKKEGG